MAPIYSIEYTADLAGMAVWGCFGTPTNEQFVMSPQALADSLPQGIMAQI